MKDYLTLNELIQEAETKNNVRDVTDDGLLTDMVIKLLNDKKYYNKIYKAIKTCIKQDTNTAFLSINIDKMMKDLKKTNKLSYIDIKQLKKVIINIINEHNLNEEHYIQYKFMETKHVIKCGTKHGTRWLDLFIKL